MRRPAVPRCASCGIREDNEVGIEVQRFHLRPARGNAGRTGTTTVGQIVLCTRCLREAGILQRPVALPDPRPELRANDPRLVHRVPA